MGAVGKGSYRTTGAPGRRVLVVAAWGGEDRALRAMVTRLKELVPCGFEILNLDSATAERYRLSSRARFGRIRRYNAAVFALTARDGASSPALQLPSEPLPFSRHFVRRIPAGYLVDGPIATELEASIDAHAHAWRLLPLGAVSNETESGDGPESLAAAINGIIGN